MAAKNKVEFLISARDLTRGVFRRIRRGLESLRRGAFQFRTALVGGLGALGIGRVVNQLNKLVASARALGVGTDTLQAWRFAAKSVGEEASTADTVFQRLQTRIGRAVTDDDRLAAAFERVGLSVADLQAMTLPQVMDQLIAATRDMDAAARQAVLEPLVDVEGIRLVSRVSEEFGSIAAVRERMERRGQILSPEMLERAERLHQLFVEIWALVRTTFINNLVPALETAARILLRLVEALPAIQDAVGRGVARGGRAIQGAVQGVRDAGTAIANIGETPRERLAREQAEAMSINQEFLRSMQAVERNTRGGSVIGE